MQYDGFPTQILIENAFVNLTTGLRAKYAMDDIYVYIICVGDYYYEQIDCSLGWGGVQSTTAEEFVKGSFLRYKEICCEECVEGLEH